MTASISAASMLAAKRGRAMEDMDGVERGFLSLVAVSFLVLTASVIALVLT
jgi:hypothetical protein